MIKTVSFWIITICLFGCTKNNKDKTLIVNDSVTKSVVPLNNQVNKTVDIVKEVSNEPPFLDTLLNNYIISLGLNDFLVSTKHDPY